LGSEFLNEQDFPVRIDTQDGTSTLYHSQKEVTYHSRFGAVQESLHVFINAGLLSVITHFQSIHVLEVGFGTGLNALLSWKTLADTQGRKLHYIGYDTLPLPESLLRECAYGKALGIDDQTTTSILQSSWNKAHKLSENFILEKKQEDFLITALPENTYHLVYFDAFSPATQAEMWTLEIFKKIFSAMISGGVLVTYCAKGAVKRNLENAGFTIESLPGPPGKREMTRARKNTIS